MIRWTEIAGFAFAILVTLSLVILAVIGLDSLTSAGGVCW